MGPTPPGTGVMARTLGLTDAKSTSPASLPVSRRFTPDVDHRRRPSCTMSPVTTPAGPAATQRMSARRQCAARSRVRVWHIVTVAWRREEELRERLADQARAADHHRLRALEGDRRSGRGSRDSPPACTAPPPACRASRWPRFIGWRPSTSFAGAIAATASSSSMPLGSGSWSRMPWIAGSALSARDGGEQLRLRAAPREEVVARGDADLVGRPLLVAHVDLGGGVLADQDDRERGLDAGLLARARRRRPSPRPGPSPRPPCRRGSAPAASGSGGEGRADRSMDSAAAGLGIDADHDPVERRRAPWRARSGSASR